MEGFYDICEEGLDVSSEQYEVPGDVGGVEAQWPGPERQGTYLPVDVDLNWVIHETLEMKWKEVWRDYYGQAMLVTLQPKVTLIPRCGPGHRNVRWMVGLKRPGEKWQWLEKGVSGELPPGCREFHNPVVLYRWPELKAPESRGEGLGASTTYATTSELSQREKSEVLRAHVNLGHPNTREFVRLLKAAGTRENIVQYVLREFSCAGFFTATSYEITCGYPQEL